MWKKVWGKQVGCSVLGWLGILFLGVWSQPGWAAVATNLVVLAPGEHFVAGSGKSGTPEEQIHGISFDTTVISVNENDQYKTSSAEVTLSAANGVFTPNTRTLTQTFGGQPNSGYSPWPSTLSPGSNSDVVITAQADVPTGVTAGQVTVPVKVMTHLNFTLPGIWIAGETRTIAVTATDGGSTVPFDGTADIIALQGGINGADTGVLGTVNLTQGRGNVDITLTYAGSGIQLRALNLFPDPSTIIEGNRTSGTFRVFPGAAAKLIIIHEEQTLQAGSSPGGSGRAGTIGTERVNESFNVTVYATDEYWNIANNATVVNLVGEEDPAWGGSVIPGSQAVGAGAAFTAVLRRDFGGAQTLTAGGGTLDSNQVAISLSHGELNKFSFTPIASPQLVGQDMTVSITAYDTWGNTLTSAGAISGEVQLTVQSVAITFDTSSHSVTTLAGAEFAGDGNWTDTAFKLYRQGNTITISVSKDAVKNTSNAFDVDLNPTLSTRYVVVLPPQSYRPGERQGEIWGRTNETTDDATAGMPINLNIYVCDFYGNKLTGGSGDRTIDVTFAVTDSVATPTQVVSSHGSINFDLTLTTSTSAQVIQASGSGVDLQGDSSDLVVHNTVLDHYSIQTTVNRTAGAGYAAVIQAEDEYDNPVSSFNGTAYLTCPVLDYLSPTQSVTNVSGGTENYNSGSATANWSLGGFTQGTRTVSIVIYRATTTETGPARLFVSDVATDTKSDHSGYIGESDDLTINPAAYTKVICIVPGQTYRPGTAEGYTGSPLSHLLNAQLAAQAYATDDYWNVKNIDASFTINSYIPANTLLNGNSCPWGTSFTHGRKEFTVQFINQPGVYYLVIDAAEPTVEDYKTSDIAIFDLDHFKFEVVGGGDFQNWAAGVSKNIKITAYEGQVDIAETFDGTVLLRYSEDYSVTHLTIAPVNSITFNDGEWEGLVTLFRADTNPEIKTILVLVGEEKFPSGQVKVSPAAPARMLIFEQGMTIYCGVNPIVIPDQLEGSPSLQTAGIPIPSIEFSLCDEYWNVVTDHAEASGNIQITSSDGPPYPATLGGAALPQTVALSLGKYTATANTAITLYNVNGEIGQSLTVTHLGNDYTFSLGSDEMEAIPVKHAGSLDSFEFTIKPNVLAQGAVAGVPFAVTISAVDEYDNTLNSTLGATPFYQNSAVVLSVDTDEGGKRSMWPYAAGRLEATQWMEGQSKPWLYLYRKTSASIQISAEFNEQKGYSSNIIVRANDYARIVSLVPGMVSSPDYQGAGGTYTGDYANCPPEADIAVFNHFGDTPQAVIAGEAVEVKAYSCDSYGNMVKQQNTEIQLTSTDRFAPQPDNIAINPEEGYALFSTFAFHTQGLERITCEPVQNSNLVTGPTPGILVVPAPFYGLQIIAPGQVAIEGSGLQGTTWYSGVTPTEPWVPGVQQYSARAQFRGVYFPVIVQSVDEFGNFIDTGDDEIELRSDDPEYAAEPSGRAGYYLHGKLTAGRVEFNCQLRTHGIRQLKPYDTDNSGIKGADDSISIVRVVDKNETNFAVFVENMALSDNQTVQVRAAPETFVMRVEVHYTETGEIIATAQPFLLEPFLSDFTSPATGTLGVVSSITEQGVATITTQTYTQAEQIVLRVRTVDGSERPTPGYSPLIQVNASDPAKIHMWSDATSYTQGAETYYQIKANENTRIYAQVRDRNDNPVSDQAMTISIISPEQTSSRLEAPEAQRSGAEGIAYRTFYAGASNLEHIIQAEANETLRAQLNMVVTVTSDGGVYPNPFNPARGEQTHIDYFLKRDANVTITLYTLLGKRVWNKNIMKGNAQGGHQGTNSILWDGKNGQGATVANGGYICLIKAGGEEKYRFKIGVLKAK